MKILWIILIALTLIMSLTACTQNINTPTGEVVRTNTVLIPEGKGRLVFTMTGSALLADLASVKMTIDAVEAFDPANGWVTINGDEDTYNLLDGSQLYLLGDKVVDAKQFTQVRMKISSVSIADNKGTHDATLPMNNLIIDAPVTVHKNSTSVVSFDFLVQQSVHRTSTGDYVFLPVVAVVTRDNAAVEINNRYVIIPNGAVVSQATYGTNVQGSTGIDVRVPPTVILVVENGEIRTIENRTIVENRTIITNTIVNTTLINNTIYVNNTQNTNTTVSGNTSNT